jgi:hypothetical protein
MLGEVGRLGEQLTHDPLSAMRWLDVQHHSPLAASSEVHSAVCYD